MKVFRYLQLLIVSGAVCSLATGSQAADLMDKGVAAAKAEHALDVKAAEETLLDALDKEIERRSKAGDLDGALAVREQKNQFANSGRLPTSKLRSVRLAVDSYQRSIRSAYKTLIATYEEAVADSTKAVELDRANALRDELRTIRREFAELPSGTGRRRSTEPRPAVTAPSDSADSAALLKAGDKFAGTWDQPNDPASKWTAALRVVEASETFVRVQILFQSQKLRSNGKIIKWGLIHDSEGQLQGDQLSLECRRVNLDQFKHNVGWSPRLTVTDKKITAWGFDLSRVSRAKGKRR